MLRLGSEAHDGVTVVRVRGEFDRCALSALPGIFERTVADAGPRVVVDMAEASFVDSGAIALLLQARKRAVGDGGDLVLARCSPMITKCLDTLGLTKVLARHVDVKSAIASFS